MRVNSINLYSNPRTNNPSNIQPNIQNIKFLGQDTYESELKVKGPSLYNGFDGSIKGDFNGISVDFDIDQKILTWMDKKKLTGTYKIDNGNKKCDLNFNQKFNLAHVYGISGKFGEKDVDIRFEDPILKYSEVTGKYNSKDVNLHINRKLSNLIRNEYKLTGEINNKKVDLNCRGLFFFGGSMEGTFDGRPVKFTTDQKFNILEDKRDVNLSFDMNNEDKEDLLFLSSALMINDLHLRR